MHNKNKKRLGFTLIEVLIVVVILGILAATVLPQFTTANNDAKEAALLQDLKTLRSQIEVYKFQHEGRFPADGSTDPQVFEDQMLLSSDLQGNTGPIGTLPYGPYFIGQLPPNPYNGARGVKIVNDVPGTAPDDDPEIGWIYNPETGQIKVNSTYLDREGRPVHEL